MSYQTEFPNNNYTIPAFISENLGWQDDSWENDVCPKFDNERLNILLWIEPTAPDSRDQPHQFNLSKTDEDGVPTDNLFNTDSEDQLFCFILALQFSAVLKEWHTPEQWADVLKLNHSPEYTDACPTHNYYDANQAMIDAYVKVSSQLAHVGLTDSGEPNSYLTKMNTAWGIARKNDFFTQTKNA